MIYNNIDTIKAKKIKHNPNKHIPNKLESKLLRKLMSENNLTEEDIRGDIKYRRMLAEASKLNKTTINKKISNWYYKLIKKACRESKLVPQHQKTIDILQTILNNYVSNVWSIPWYIFNIKTNAKEVVKFYAKT